MGSNINDMVIQFSKLTRSEIDKFYLDHGIDPSLETKVPGDKTSNQCPKGFLVFYTRIPDQPNLRYPFKNYFFGRFEMHFEILCCALSYDPFLLMFRRFSVLPGRGTGTPLRMGTGTPLRKVSERLPFFLLPSIIRMLGKISSFSFPIGYFFLLLSFVNFLRV
ncbi:hypothetical protein Hanom_Chr11g01018711 [Helianthus anomalus]